MRNKEGVILTTSKDIIQRIISPQIRALSAYSVASAEGYIKLDAMENPYQWSSDLRDVWLQRLHDAPINRYPDPSAKNLMKQLAAVMAVPDGMSLVLGNGSDELIQMLIMAVAGQGAVMSPEPGFVMYKMLATMLDVEYIGVPLQDDDFQLDMSAMLAAIKQHQPALIFLAYPNNPTGNLYHEGDIEQIIQQAPGLVVIDEAYAAFTEHSYMSRLGQYNNVLVMRTVSKMGLAGLRLGLLAGAPEWIQEINKIRLPYNINVLTQISAEFALEHHQVLDQQTAMIRNDRAGLFEQLGDLPGLHAFPSEANFILLRVPQSAADKIHQALRDEHKILIKNLHGSHPLLQDCLRVTVGTVDENKAFVQALKMVLVRNTHPTPS
ncbi:MAG: histidinol-phosphate transaminase [Gammaproteobacteria bacterium]|nr:histidinol-phosphate transaminase [Gammaproteobacteria bacterium]